MLDFLHLGHKVCLLDDLRGCITSRQHDVQLGRTAGEQIEYLLLRDQIELDGIIYLIENYKVVVA